MTKFCIDIPQESIDCWMKYKESLARSAKHYAAQKGITLKDVVVTDAEAMLGLFDCVKEEGIFCWGILWDIVERTTGSEE